MELAANDIRPGVSFAANGDATVRLWAPGASSAELVLENGGARFPLQRAEFGYWTLETSALRHGEPYQFSIDGKEPLPDPASVSQPGGPHQASQALDLARFSWSDGDWRNPALAEYIFYELHVGTFTPEGTFDGAIRKLDHLVALGITAIEIMPVAQFAGERNWGYDGVFPYAVQHSYGGADGLRRLVNACHRKGLAVVLDVVYNHLGPEGNYLGEFGPYFTGKYQTPWGNAINFDDAWCDGVREYFIQNALMWFRDFHIDTLRLDAVHAIKDFSTRHILEELRARVDALAADMDRAHYLIVELDLNDPRFITSRDDGGFGMHAQWVDEFHHALRVTAGGERNGYYADFNGIRHLVKAYSDAYVYDGQWSAHRHKNFGRPVRHVDGSRFVVFSQNHDQVGNRMLGERTSTLHSFALQKVLAAAVLVSPYLPMLFMGEEYGEPNPFQYFVSHTDAHLAQAVREGRKAEFAAFHAEGEAPDPMAVETFERSKLQWQLVNHGRHSLLFRFYQTLIGLRKQLPVLGSHDRRQLAASFNETENTLALYRWQHEQRSLCLFNFSAETRHIELPGSHRWHKALDSAAPEWGGETASPETLDGAALVAVEPQSVLIYLASYVQPDNHLSATIS